MESESNVSRTTERRSLEARLGTIVFNATASGFLVYGLIDQVLEKNYVSIAALALLNVGSLASLHHQLRKTLEDYRM